MHDADERRDVGAFRQRIVEEVAAVDVCARQQTSLFEPHACARRHGGKVEESKLQMRRASRGGREKHAFAAADVQEAPMTRNVVGVERFLRDHRLRRSHEGAVRADLLRRQRLGRIPVRIGPVVGELAALFLAQQRHGIGEICVKQRLVFDDGERRAIAGEGGAEQSEPVFRAASLGKVQRRGRLEQALRGGFGKRQLRRQRVEAQRAVAQHVEEPELRAGDENLRIDEAGGEIEAGARAAPRQRARHRVFQRPALESRIGDEPVARAAQSLAPLIE